VGFELHHYHFSYSLRSFVCSSSLFSSIRADNKRRICSMQGRLGIVVILSLALCGCVRTSATSRTSSAETKSAPTISFENQVKPILQARCQPCHFSGGVMYKRLPFDRPETIKTLGTKLFTRLKDEKEQRIISEFLAQ
jgi:hypothetical protein